MQAPAGSAPYRPTGPIREPRPATLTVTGTGEVSVVPDALRLELGTEAAAVGVAEAMVAARTAMAAIREVVSATGVAPADQRTTGLTIWPRHDNATGAQTGYVASENLTVLLRRPDLVDVVLTAAAEVAGDLLRVHGLGFTVTDATAAQDEARRLAVAEARRRAELYAAELGGATLGALVRLVEGGAGLAVVHGRDAAVKLHAGGAEPGAQVVAIQVTAEWALGSRRRPPVADGAPAAETSTAEAAPADTDGRVRPQPPAARDGLPPLGATPGPGGDEG